MHLAEQRVDSDRRGRAGKRRRERAVAAAGRALRARPLDGMRRIEAHRRELPEDDQRAHVDDEVVIAERGAPLGQEDVAGAHFAKLVDDVLHVFRREELPLLHVHGPSGLAGGSEEIGLPAEERRNLQHVRDFGGGSALPDLVHVGEHGQADFLLHAGEDPQPFDQTGTAKGLSAGAIRLVEAALEDGRDSVLLRGVRHLARLAQRELLAFDHARTRDDDQLPAAEFHALATGVPGARTISGAAAVCAGGGTESPLRARCSRAALTKPAKSGCGWKGLLWNSGWYWQPMK